MVGWDDKGVYRIKRGASLLAQSSDASSSTGNEFVQFKCKCVCVLSIKDADILVFFCVNIPLHLQGKRTFGWCSLHSRRKEEEKNANMR